MTKKAVKMLVALLMAIIIASVEIATHVPYQLYVIEGIALVMWTSEIYHNQMNEYW